MKKKLLLTSFAVLSSIGLANAVCTPPTPLKCECAHPIIENGVLVCGSSYCGDKKCMPDGSCCETDKYCEITEECCSKKQKCDPNQGCVTAPLEACTTGPVEIGGKTYNLNANWMDWFSATASCSLVSFAEICPNPIVDDSGNTICPEVSGTCSGLGFFTADERDEKTGLVIMVDLEGGIVERVEPSISIAARGALCH